VRVAESIEDVKQRLSGRYLGKEGVHAIGFSRAQNTLRLYVHAEPGADWGALQRKAAKDAAPYKVVVIEEERPTIS
jgi:hypothetical protein